jgi:hypothetical protein
MLPEMVRVLDILSLCSGTLMNRKEDQSRVETDLQSNITEVIGGKDGRGSEKETSGAGKSS